MTQSPHTAGRAESLIPTQKAMGAARGVKTDGAGKATVRHLNLTKLLAYFDERRVQAKVRKELRLARKDRAARQ